MGRYVKQPGETRIVVDPQLAYELAPYQGRILRVRCGGQRRNHEACRRVWGSARPHPSEPMVDLQRNAPGQQLHAGSRPSLTVELVDGFELAEDGIVRLRCRCGASWVIDRRGLAGAFLRAVRAGRSEFELASVPVPVNYGDDA